MAKFLRDLVMFDISVNTMLALDWLRLDSTKQAEEVKKAHRALCQQISFKSLSCHEKNLWSEVLEKIGAANDVHGYALNFGETDFFIGERARLKGIPSEANPYSSYFQGAHLWQAGWDEQNKRSLEDDAYRNNDEWAEWQDDIKAQLARE